MRHSQLTDELQEQASMYASGAMPEDERQEYARHLQEDDCAVCVREVREFESVAQLFALSLPMQTPSATVKSRLIAQASAGPAVPTPRLQARLTPLRVRLEWITGLTAIVACAVLAVVLKANIDLRRLADSLNTRIAQLESELNQGRLMLATLTSPEIRVFNLAGQGANSAADARIFWDQTRRRWFVYVRRLPPVANDRTYQLWFVPRTGNPISATVFNTSPDGSANVDIPVPEEVKDLRAAAVTTEPAGGLPQPSGPFALLGALE